MAPTLRHLFHSRDFRPGDPSDSFQAEWSDPSNYAFTVLLLVGGDLINRALAQMAGGWITPVAFSFDTGCCLINGKNGYVRGNNSWVWGRMMRDYEYWMGGGQVAAKTDSLLTARWMFDQQIEAERSLGAHHQIPRPSQAGLVVSVWKPSQTRKHGEPGHDLLHWSGLVVTVIRMGVAAIPLGLNGDLGVLMITAAATVLCYTTGELSQWKVEKWACRHLDSRQRKNFILTRGNGAQHAIAIISEGHGLDLEDLATGFANIDAPTITVFAQLATVFLGVLWIALLITASGLPHDSWYLMAVGGVGMLQNIFVAGLKRTPAVYGIPLDFVEVIGEVKVMETLMEVERKYEKLGQSMIGTFFPGDLREHEVKEWAAIADEWKAKKAKSEDLKGK